jgi:dihydrofolate synthase / folylpolyglutamate synthase
MRITPVKSVLVTPGSTSILALIDETIVKLHEGDILAITSKVVSLCENNVVPFGDSSKEDLVKKESNLHLSQGSSAYGIQFTITNHTLIPSAGIDESNGDNNYILWPMDSQVTANNIREHLVDRFKLKNVGVLITDSTCQPLRRGTIGVALAHSGFLSIRNYIGTPDLFGRSFSVSQANISGGLASAAVLAMGEGTEQTPFCIMSDMPFVTFQSRNPTEGEIDSQRITLEEDLFAPFLTSIKWEHGQRNNP